MSAIYEFQAEALEQPETASKHKTWTGLSPAEVIQRRETYGENVLPARSRPHP
jgi:hypothetical protein